MSMSGSSPLGTMLGLFAALAVLSLFVQVVQEIYKFLTNSKGKAYTRVLVDLLGPWAAQLQKSESAAHLLARGPFQFKRVKPGGVLLPMDEGTLASALERTAPGWVQRALEVLRLEVRMQAGVPKPPSPSWRKFMTELREYVTPPPKRGRDEQPPLIPPGIDSAKEVFEFLDGWDEEVSAQVGTTRVDAKRGRREGAVKTKAHTPSTAPLNAAELLIAFRKRFLSHVLDAERDYPQLTRNFEHNYQRRNLRHSFTVAFLVAFFFNLPIQELLRGASRLSDAEVVAVAERATALHAQVTSMAARRPDDPAADNLRDNLQTLLGQLAQRSPSPNSAELTDLTRRRLSAGWSEKPWSGRGYFLLGCVVSALLITFGAPLLNDLIGALGVAQKRARTDCNV